MLVHADDLPGGAPARSGATPFFALVFASTWLFQLPAILAQYGILSAPVERFMPLVVVGFFGPTIIAVLLARFTRGGEGVRALFRPLGVWRVAPGWYLISLGLSSAVFVTSMAVYTRFAGDAGPWCYPPASAPRIASLLIVPFTEQIAWRGFAYPPLERRFGPLNASLLVGALWALFHVQKQCFLGPGVLLGVVATMVTFMTAGTVVFTWIYRRTHQSLLLVVLAQMGVHLNNSTEALPTHLLPFVIHCVGFCVVALALVRFDRKVWRRAT